ncbi:class I SAM-dependent methyltransferase [Herbivorax sp. ANBcel31]|uniref:class I SAM-dependent methyltransferase n=1 Tax=Herbivorax sp. ANBcel31 TaxID=3069754 RepID=UPI0027B4282A|nr:class I SAM-dependent methyltransferase [Herbivorax sp. ANBcel31]MDQ2087998.1 class I SAM-dependent methyltransferase [Herbivorax sp. ANBcel31]
MDKISRIKDHFEDEAKEFDEIILKLIPYYAQMIEALVLSIPFGEKEKFRVIDLGCGTGTISCSIKKKYPNAEITCLDIAENMISISQAKLKEFENINYIINDFYNFNFDKHYDIVISSLALHHLMSDEDKKLFYKKIYNSLTDRGVFYNADVVLASSEYIQKIYMNKWKEYMLKNVSNEEVENKWLPRYYEEDTPTKLINHIKWMEEIGYKNIDVIWKYYNFTVYGGYK